MLIINVASLAAAFNITPQIGADGQPVHVELDYDSDDLVV
jgi:hypothetical protein